MFGKMFKRREEMRSDVVFILVGSRLDYRRKSEECWEPRDVLHETVVLRSLLLLISTSQLKRNVNLDERIIRKKQEEDRGRERKRERKREREREGCVSPFCRFDRVVIILFYS